MAYSTSNPPALVAGFVGKGKGRIWLYDSADASTVVRVNGYFTNAHALGIKVGDLIFQIDTAGATRSHTYIVNSVTTGGACDVTDGTATASLTDTD